MYGDIYTEAQELYEDIKRKNPGRKDLTKTVDFMSVAMPYKTIPLYYYAKEKKQQQKPRRTSTPRSTSSTSHMVLNIPLMASTEISTTAMEDTEIPSTTTTRDLEIPASPPMLDQTTAMEDTEIPSTTTTRDLEIPASPPMLDQEDPTPQLEIPDHVYEDLLHELRQDPELYKILNDFNPLDHNDTGIQENVEIQYDDDEGNKDMWDAFTFQEQTPLERELLRQGY